MFFLAVSDAHGVLDHTERLIETAQAVMAYYNACPTPPQNDAEAATYINTILEVEMEAGLKIYDDTCDFIVRRFLAVARSCSSTHDWGTGMIARANEKWWQSHDQIQQQQDNTLHLRQLYGQPLRIGEWGED